MSVQEDVSLIATLEAQDDASAIVEDVRQAYEDVGTAINNLDTATATAGEDGRDAMDLLGGALSGVQDFAALALDAIKNVAAEGAIAGVALLDMYDKVTKGAEEYAGQLTTVEFLTGENSQESAALIAGFEGVGITTGGAVSMMTRLSAALGVLSTAQHANGQISKAQQLEMKNLGISFLNSHGDMLPMTQLLPTIIDHLGAMTNITERDRLARTLFGRSFADLAPLILAGGAAFKQAEGDAARFGNNLSQDQVDALNAWKAAQEKAAEAIAGFTGDMALMALPILMKVKETIQALGQAYAGLPTHVKENIQNTLALVAIFGPLLGGAKALELGMKTISSLFPTFGAGLTALLTPMLPFITVIGVVVAAVFALYLAYTHIHEVHQLLQPAVRQLGAAWNEIHKAIQFGLIVWNNTHDAVTAVEGALVKLGVPVQTVVSWGNLIRAGWSAVSDGFRSIAAVVVPALHSAFVQLQPLMAQLRDAFVQLRPVMDVLGPIFAAMGAAALLLIGGAFGLLVGFLRGALPAAIQFVVDVIHILVLAFKLISDVVKNVAAIIMDIVHGDFNKAFEDLKKLFFQLGEDVMMLIGQLVMTVVHLFQGLGNTLILTVEGFLTGIINMFKWLWDQLVGHSIIPDLINDIVRWFESLPDQVIGIISGLATRAVSAAVGLGQAIVAGLRAGLGGLENLLKHALKAMLDNIPFGGGQAAINALGLQGYALGTMAGPSFGGPKFGIFGEGQDEVVANATQMAAVGRNLSGGGQQQIVIHNYTVLDGKVIQRSVMKGAANDFRLRGGSLGSAA
jgi:hypothetical protein